MLTKDLLMFIADWLIPRGYLHYISRLKYRFAKLDKNIQAELSKNASYKELHRGKRCFILGTGPSIAKQNLTPLRREYCISVNSFYLHKDYAKIKPQYHIISGLALHKHIPREIGLKWFKEIKDKTDKAELFLNYKDKETIQKEKLFRNRKVSYLFFSDNWDSLNINGIDATKCLYTSQSVSIMALQIALYMGFSKIYLLGMDHDWILRLAERKSNHFYTSSQSTLESAGVTDWIGSNWSMELYSQYVLWKQYQIIKDYSEEKLDTEILNATSGGLLDVFKRVDIQQLI